VPVTESILCSIIHHSPSKQSQLDPVPTWLLKKSLHLVAPFLTDLVNASLLTSTVPIAMKAAVVTPILKKDNLDSTVISNYRPISNLSFMSKVIERVVCKQLTQYLESEIFFRFFSRLIVLIIQQRRHLFDCTRISSE